MKEMYKLHAEALRLLTIYEEHKDAGPLQKKVHLDVDRFLMENREVAMILLVQGLQDAIEEARRKEPAPWYKRLLRGRHYASQNSKVR